MATPWKHIWLLWFCGVVAAAEYGKIAPLVGVLQAQYHLSLTAAGWLSSAIEFGAASCGLLGSLFIDRFGLRRAIHVGLLCLTLGSLCEGLPWLAGLWLSLIHI